MTEADIISTVEFDHTGNYLATGDKGGRVVLFERHESKKQTCEYKFYTEFQSHEPEFDYLKSLEIEEKINKIRWCRRQNQAHFLLSTNGAWCCAVLEEMGRARACLLNPAMAGQDGTETAREGRQRLTTISPVLPR